MNCRSHNRRYRRNAGQYEPGRCWEGEAFIQNEEPCDFCTLSEECPKGMRCYGGEPIEPACTDLSDHFVEMCIDKEAILEYLEGLEE